MTLPDETLHLSQEEQGRLLARVYAFILSDQFTGEPKTAAPEKKPRRKKTAQSQEEHQIVDANLSNLEPLA
jgi:uncharacterized protein YdaU (DUF1376 family)